VSLTPLFRSEISGEKRALSIGMILLVSTYQNALDCAALIQDATHESVKTVTSIRQALNALRVEEFVAVVVDENLLEATPGSFDSLAQRMSAAIPILIDMACLKPERTAKLVNSAFSRRRVEYKMARDQAIAELKSELKSDLTGLMISSRLAMESIRESKANDQLSAVLEIAQRIQHRLETK
jgi:hypothetical protein